MRHFPIYAGAALAVVFSASPAYAGKADDAWATCLWDKVPTSASNWIAMPEGEKWSSNPEDRWDNLKIRLEGACKATLTPEGKKSAPRFNASKVRLSLIATRPTSVGPDHAEPKAHMCKILEGDVLLGFMKGFGDPTGIKPQAPATEVKCFYIQNDGSLIDA